MGGEQMAVGVCFILDLLLFCGRVLYWFVYVFICFHTGVQSKCVIRLYVVNRCLCVVIGC